MGKCISFSLAFPAAKFYIREMAAAIAAAFKGGEVNLSPSLREEIVFWRFLDSWDKVIRRRSERHGGQLAVSRLPSRSDAMEIVQHHFGGIEGHDLRLMSLDSNAQHDKQ